MHVVTRVVVDHSIPHHAYIPLRVWPVETTGVLMSALPLKHCTGGGHIASVGITGIAIVTVVVPVLPKGCRGCRVVSFLVAVALALFISLFALGWTMARGCVGGS